MRGRAFAFILSVLFFSAIADEPAEKKSQRLKIDRLKIPTAIIGNENSRSTFPRNMHSARRSGAIGPGKFLMSSYYDYGSNGGVLTNLVDYEDGTLAVARMASANEDASARGAYWSYFDGVQWSSMTKVDQGDQAARGWSSLSAFVDGRSVVQSHAAIYDEINFDALQGVGIWTTLVFNHATVTQARWPRAAVDTDDHIIVCSSLDGTQAGIRNRKEVLVTQDVHFTEEHHILWPDTSVRKPEFRADDQAIDIFENRIAIAAAELGGDIHLWESADHAHTWTYRNLTNYPTDIPIGGEEHRPWSTCEVLFDNQGRLHIFWEAVLAGQDIAGTELELFHHRRVGIQHWSMASGVTQVVAWSDIVGSEIESDEDLFRAGNPFDQTNAMGTLTMQPQAGIDKSNNLYLIFAAYRPGDFDEDSTHFTDIYALSSFDGGKEWRTPVNLTNTPQSEDLWASMADNINDSLRLVYQSDDNTGNSIHGGGFAPTTLLYYAFGKNNVPPVESNTIAIAFPDELNGWPNSTATVPVLLSLYGNHVEHLSIALKATDEILSFAGYSTGPLAPDSLIEVNASAADSVQIIFHGSGNNFMSQDGVFANLNFLIEAQANVGDKSMLVLSNLIAIAPNSDTLRVVGHSGEVNVTFPPGEIRGTVWNDLDGNGKRDITEAGISGWQINIAQATSISMQTDSMGNYSFTSFSPGTYTISQVLQQNWQQTFPSPPLEDHTVELELGRTITDINFGNWKPSSIRGMTWYDMDHNGLRDEDEPGLAGWQIQLIAKDTLHTVTDFNGNYSFDALVSGSYIISEILPAGWRQIFPSNSASHEVALEPGHTLDSVNFGNWFPEGGSIRGMVWNDLNENGTIDTEENGLAGWRVNIAGPETLSATSNAGGKYWFGPLPPGMHAITQTLFEKWHQTFPPSSGSYSVTLEAGQSAFGFNFGNKDTSSTAVADDQYHLPEAFVLSQNYPNPFNPATKIQYSIPRKSQVLLEVFNLSGRRVAVLVQGVQGAGFYKAEFHAGKLPSGLYLYKLTAGDFVAIKKMLVMR